MERKLLMNNILYAKAFAQVLVLLKQLPQKEYDKIPRNEIEYLEKNKDIEYVFNFDYSKLLEEQDISLKAHSIIVKLFRDYFCDDEQKQKIENILQINNQISENGKSKRYSNDIIFKKPNQETEPNKEIATINQPKWYARFWDIIRKFLFTKK